MALGTIVDTVLLVLIVEAVALAVVHRRIGLPRFIVLLPNLAAGLFLVLALRSVVTHVRIEVVALFLALGGLAHVVDLFCRRR